MHFQDMTGDHKETDDILKGELMFAGINIYDSDSKDPFTKGILRGLSKEVKTSVRGELHGWNFERKSTYWEAKGPGINIDVAEELYENYGGQIRVDGQISCPNPREYFKGLACGHYHVDTQEGLKELADTIKKIVKESEEKIFK